MKRSTIGLLTLLGLAAAARAIGLEEMGIPIPNSRFDFGGGEIVQHLELEPCIDAPPIVQELGKSGWYASSRPTCLQEGGHFYPGIAVDDTVSGTGVAIIRRHSHFSACHHIQSCESEAWMWMPLPGVTLEANNSYTLAVDVDAGQRLDDAALAAQGFGIGLATQGSSVSHGPLFVDSLRLPSIVELVKLKGTNQRLSISFETGQDVPVGDLVVVIFAIRPETQIESAAVRDYRLDNVSLLRRHDLGLRLGMPRPTALGSLPEIALNLAQNRYIATPATLVPATDRVEKISAAPEPSTALLLLGGAMVFLARRPTRDCRTA